MKKIFALLALFSVAALAGCEETKIYYEGELRPVSEVEEIIADQLEVENPDLDLEVGIFEESDD
ncbi:hypothetical protein NSS70_04435 [Aeribacillus sp. FSL K6-2848]|jgi:hypothetical protein|uniref:hypothetical protein n=1 Tax=Aeribacillus sp. FSL K6-2848 TaxID=2954612 RepID=UPI0030F71834